MLAAAIIIGGIIGMVVVFTFVQPEQPGLALGITLILLVLFIALLAFSAWIASEIVSAQMGQ